MIEQILMGQGPGQQSSPVILQERLATAQAVLTGEISPIERRQELMRSRLGVGQTSPSRTTPNRDVTEVDETPEDPAANTSKRASRNGTASQREIEQAPPKVGASRPDDSDDEDSDGTTESVSAHTPSMSEAAAEKKQLKIEAADSSAEDEIVTDGDGRYRSVSGKEVEELDGIRSGI